jgi:putative PIN family toxin of toxin-antitoxin system
VVDVPVWVLDTNVLVSGLLSPWGPPGRLVDALLLRRLTLALDDRIELEYRDVLSRPRLNIEPDRRDAFLAITAFQSHVVAQRWPFESPPDRDDVPFLEVALAVSARTVVTGNLKHFPLSCRGPISVLSPMAAWDRLSHFESNTTS